VRAICDFGNQKIIVYEFAPGRRHKMTMTMPMTETVIIMRLARDTGEVSGATIFLSVIHPRLAAQQEANPA
jgi:hypothetical protein